MTTTVITLSDTAKDARVQCLGTSSNYAAARTGSGTLQADSADISVKVGQSLVSTTYACIQNFLLFDTSIIPPNDTIVSAVISLYSSLDSSGTDFDIEVYASPWTSPIGPGDFVDGSTLSAGDVLTSLNTSSWSVGAYNDIPSSAAMIKSISLSGETGFMLASSRHRTGDAPVALEHVTSRFVGSSDPPKLTITHFNGDMTGINF